MTTVEKVLTLKQIDFLETAGPRHLLALAELVREVEKIAEEKGCNAAQLALAWVLAQGDDIVPIPCTKHVRYLDENIGALDVKLTHEDLQRLEAILPPGAARTAQARSQASPIA